jgi:rubredoxin
MVRFRCRVCRYLWEEAIPTPGSMTTCPGCHYQMYVPECEAIPSVDSQNAVPGQVDAVPKTPELVIRFQCPNCGIALEISAEYAGQVTDCPHCKQPIQLPIESQQEFFKEHDSSDREPFVIRGRRHDVDREPNDGELESPANGGQRADGAGEPANRPRRRKRRRRGRRPARIEDRMAPSIAADLWAEKNAEVAQFKYYLCLSGGILCFLLGFCLLGSLLLLLGHSPKDGFCFAFAVLPIAALLVYLAYRLIWDWS